MKQAVRHQFNSFFLDANAPRAWQTRQRDDLASQQILIQGSVLKIEYERPEECYLLIAENKLWMKQENDFKVFNLLYTLTEKQVDSLSFSFHSGEYSFEIILGNLYEYEDWLKVLQKMVVFLGFTQHFQIRQTIGRGSFAEVIMVREFSTKLKFAVKAFDKLKLMNDPIEKLAIRKEIEILREINHQNIIRMYQVYEQEDKIFLCEELLTGGDLMRYYFKKAKHDETHIINYMKQLFSSIEYLHSKGIMHRDIKPENLLLRDRDGQQLCIVDLGLADFYNMDGRYLFTKCGTPGYVAPEILHEIPYNTKVDVFSVGVIMYILLCGQLPFKSKSYYEVVQKNYDCKIDFNFKQPISAEAMDLLKKVLQKDFKNRLSASEALQHPWFKNTYCSNFEWDTNIEIDDEIPLNTDYTQKNDISIRTTLMIRKNLNQSDYSQSPQTPADSSNKIHLKQMNVKYHSKSEQIESGLHKQIIGSNRKQSFNDEIFEVDDETLDDEFQEGQSLSSIKKQSPIKIRKGSTNISNKNSPIKPEELN